MATQNSSYDLTVKTIRHDSFNKAAENIRSAITLPFVSPSIILTGPPKVGMTRLRQELVREVQAELSNPGMTPVVDIGSSIDVASGLGSMEAQIHRRILAQLKDPYLTDETVICDNKNLFGVYEPMVRKFDSRDLTTLRKQTMTRLTSENCKVVFVDILPTITPVDQLTATIKCVRYLQNLALDSRIPFVIFCNYDVIRNEEFLTELYEKSQIIHFQRYALPDGYPAFMKALKKLDEILPSESEFSLIEGMNSQYMYAHSLGCVGRLIDILQNALKFSVGKKTNLLSIESINANKGLPRAISKLNEYIKIGEEMLSENNKQWEQIYGEVSSCFSNGYTVECAQDADKEPQNHVA